MSHKSQHSTSSTASVCVMKGIKRIKIPFIALGPKGTEPLEEHQYVFLPSRGYAKYPTLPFLARERRPGGPRESRRRWGCCRKRRCVASVNQWLMGQGNKQGGVWQNDNSFQIRKGVSCACACAYTNCLINGIIIQWECWKTPSNKVDETFQHLKRKTQ